MTSGFKRKFILVLAFTIFLFPAFVLADSQGQTKTFFINKAYDVKNRTKVQATLKVVSKKAYFYIGNSWYDGLTKKEKGEVDKNLKTLSQEFDNKIYPTLTSTYGTEWKPGIDSDYHITILFHQIKKGVGGYFNSGDEYSKIQNRDSNEREMVYLNARYIVFPIIKSYLAHEFTHLITFNQKDRLRGISEDIWLNEARADYSPSLMGYDQEYQGSNLQQRVREFISSPSDSLTEWNNQQSDYGVINLFTQYLVEHYGIAILADSLKSQKTGIVSINYALKKNGSKEDFFQIFTDWTITVFLNNCGLGEKYCYKNKNLKNFKISPSLIFLPSTQKTEVSLDYSIKRWAGHWYRIMGEGGNLELEFNGADAVKFKVPYVLCKDSQDCKISFLDLDKNEEGRIFFKDFSKKWISLTIIPLIQSKVSDFGKKESSFAFSLRISMQIKSKREKLIEELNAQIANLKIRIAELQAKIAKILSKKISCRNFSQNLYFGMKNSQVRCLQEFLKSQGRAIYPEALTTGYFGGLTKEAIIRFQEKYASEILAPLGLKNSTGFVGPATRKKLNQLLKNEY